MVGANVNGVTLAGGGALIVDSGGVATNLTVSSAGNLSIYDSFVSGAIVSSGATAVVTASGQLWVTAGQTVNGVTAVSGGYLIVDEVAP